MNGKKILFITPPYHCGVVEAAGHWIPLTFVYLAGAAREAGFDPVIYDAMTLRDGHEDIARRIADESPAIVAVTAITATVIDSIKVIEAARRINPAIITVIGGVHPSFMFKEALANPAVDFVVCGEGEVTLRELLLCLDRSGYLEPVQKPARRQSAAATAGETNAQNDALAPPQEQSRICRRTPGGFPDKLLSKVAGIAYRNETGSIIATAPRQAIEDLDTLSTAWDLIDWKQYTMFPMPGSRLGAISTSRGCNHDCTFCSQQKFWQRTWRGRRPANIVGEIEHLRDNYGVNVVLFSDEYPTRDAERWEKLLDLLIEKNTGTAILMETRPEDIVRDRAILWKYRKAGVIHIYIGVEATNQETLDLIKKDASVQTGIDAIRLLDEHGIITETSFILGFPHETKASVSRTMELSRIYNPDFAHYLALAPWPYADMYSELEPYIVERDYRKYNLIDPVIKPTNMTLAEIDWSIVDCYRQFYMGKLKEVLEVKDAFKKQYMLKSMMLIMSCSFITEKLGSLGKMPPEMAKAIAAISEAHTHSKGHASPHAVTRNND